ncbi:MAG: S16 family serine protease [Acidimicrobiales bacterium]
MTEAAQPPNPTAPPPPPAPRARRRWPVVLGVVLVVVLALVIVASRINLNYYALTPGDAQPVDPLIRVPPAQGHPVHGQVLLTDVYVAQLTLLTYLPNEWDSDADVVPADELLGPYTPPDQLTDQGYLEMAQSKDYARAAAFTRLGHHVGVQSVGAQVFAVAPGSPADPGLSVGQVIKAAGGTPTPDTCALVGVLHRYAPGQRVTLSVQQTTFNDKGTPVPGRTVSRTVRLGVNPHPDVPTGCPGVTGPNRAYLGVELEDQQHFTYPFPVSVDTSQIGGPSAGLAMTLSIVNKLSTGDITDGYKVAATGTIDPTGAVGDVGGVAQKTVAVEQAGARVFFVPRDEYHDAVSKDIASLKIYPVSSLDQALSILRRLGGHVPPAPTGATTAAIG